MKCPKCDFDNPDTVKFCGECGTQLTSADELDASLTRTLETPFEDLPRGNLFAERYEIIESLGTGGMGKVYRAIDREVKEEVALKLVKPEIAQDEATIKRFRNELKVARKVSHRNVCRMHDLGKAEEGYYISMEYVEGENLKSYIRKIGKLTEEETISLAQQVCEGLKEAHELGVIHRDMKPQNIMIDRDGRVKIMDFGIARSVEAQGVTATGVIIGTPDYISPEQAEGEEADQRSDIYTLGVILYEMVTGSVPFKGDTALSVALKHKTQIPRDPKKLNPDISENLSRLILICMEKDRERRYQTAEELLSDLRNIQEGFPLGTKIRPRRDTFASAMIRNKLFIPALVVALALVAVLIWQFLPQKGETPTLSDKPSLAVVYFENNTGDEDLEHWRKGISDLLITDLTQSKYLKVLSGDKLFNILSQLNQLDAKGYSSEVLEEVASRGRVNHILRGSYSRAGDIIRIDIMLQDASTGEPIATERVEGTGEESIFSLVDDLTRRVKASFNLSEEKIAGDLDRQVGEITTSSPEAYKYYLEGVRFENMGDYQKTLEFMEKAVAVDSGFASAYNLMSVVCWILGLDSKRYAQKAFELRDRVTDKERYEIEAEFYAYSEKTYDKSIAAWNKLLELHPEHDNTISHLGWTYNQIEEWDKAIELLSINVRNKVDFIQPYQNLSLTYRAKGLYEKAIKVLEFYLDNISDNANIHLSLARTYLCQSKYEIALNEANKALSAEDVFLVKASIYSCRGEFFKAEKEIQLYLEKADVIVKIYGLDLVGAIKLSQGKIREAEEANKQALKLANEIGDKFLQCYSHYGLAYTYLKSGKPGRAIEEIEKAWNLSVEEEDLDMQRRSLFSKGLIYLEMGLLDKALLTAEELKNLIDSGMNKKAIKYYHHLMGMLMLQNENFPKAIELFNQALSFLPFQSGIFADYHALFIEPLALSYYKSGNLEMAIEKYERIISLTWGRLYFGDIYAKSFNMLGKIYEQKGWKGKAIEHYEKFLDLWKDADPGIADVEDAKKRLAGLKSR